MASLVRHWTLCSNLLKRFYLPWVRNQCSVGRQIIVPWAAVALILLCRSSNCVYGRVDILNVLVVKPQNIFFLKFNLLIRMKRPLLSCSCFLSIDSYGKFCTTATIRSVAFDMDIDVCTWLYAHFAAMIRKLKIL